MPIYRKRRATLVWHWSSDCSNWPADTDFDQLNRFPNANVAEFCKECLSLARAPQAHRQDGTTEL
jgi:hypothetical protein